MPVSGEVVEVNAELEDNPEWVNEHPYGKAWWVKVTPSNLGELDDLMDVMTYESMWPKRKRRVDTDTGTGYWKLDTGNWLTASRFQLLASELPASRRIETTSPNTDADRAAMLAMVGAESVADLFRDVPEKLRFPT